MVTLLGTLDDRGVPIAAICGATLAIARAGLIRGRHHTSNGLDYLREQVKDYSDPDRYVDAPAVRDRHLITASGLADVEAEIFAKLGVFTDADRALGFQYFRGGRIPTEKG